MTISPQGEDEVTLYASWNGATEVSAWRVSAGPTLDSLDPVGSVPRRGFETVIDVRTGETHVGVQAEDRSGEPVGRVMAAEIRRPRENEA